MNKVIKIFFIIFFTIFVIISLLMAGYFTKIMTANRETVKDMSYDLSKSYQTSVGNTLNLLGADYTSTNIDKHSKITISDVSLQSLNTKTNKIIAGQDYYLYYTVTFKPEDFNFEMQTLNSLGKISSDNWTYNNYAVDSNEKYYLGVIKAGETKVMRFYIKTNETPDKLGFYTSASIDKETYRNYLRLTNINEKTVNENIEK